MPPSARLPITRADSPAAEPDSPPLSRYPKMDADEVRTMMSISPPASGGGENITAADCTSSTRNMKNRQRSASDRVRSSRRNRENSVTLRRERRERFGIGVTPSFRIILYRCPRIGPSPPADPPGSSAGFPMDGPSFPGSPPVLPPETEVRFPPFICNLYFT